LPVLPAAFGRAAVTLTLLASVACTGSSTPSVPTPGPTATATATPDPRAAERLALATYCIDAVDAIDARASKDEAGLEESLADLRGDAASLPTGDLRAEANDLIRFLDDPKNAPKDRDDDVLTEWRLQHTPATCLDVTGLRSELTVEQRAQLPAPTSRATTRWFGRADNGELALAVLPLAVPDEDCTVHTFPIATGEAGSGAYRSDCRSWGKKSRHNFVMIEVTGTAPEFRLSDFMAFDRKGRIHSPVDVIDQANDPDNFMPPRGSVTATGRRGFVVFEVEDLQVRAIVFHHLGDLLVVIFEGNESTFPRSSG
jgi:hypothetical protein